MVMQRDMTAGTNTKKPKGNFENAIHVFVHEVSKPRTKSVGTFMYSTYWNIPHLPGGGGRLQHLPCWQHCVFAVRFRMGKRLCHSPYSNLGDRHTALP